MECQISLRRILFLAALQGWFPGSESQDLLASLPESIPALRGSCVEIPCTFPWVFVDFQLIWYREQPFADPQIFNNENPLDIHEAFRGRTFLVGNESNSCSLRIDDVRDSETYYPCINGNINCNQYRGFNKVRVQVTDTPERPVLTLPPSLTEGTPARITCSVQHTCAHNPPVLQWNKVGFNRTERSEELEGGVWRFVSEIEYIPTYQDDGSPIVCESNYRTGQVLEDTATLDITYPPKNVTVIKLDGEKKIEEGEEVTLQCASDANPPANNYTWYRIKKKEELKEHGEEITVTINWENVMFSCSARNWLGNNDSAIIDLRLFFYAKVAHMGGKREFEEGEVLQLECHFSMSRQWPFQYSWYRNRISLNNETQRTLRIYDVKESHSGNYSCKVYTSDGNFSSLLFAVTVTACVPGNSFSKIIILPSVIAPLLIVLILYYILRKRQLQCPAWCQGKTNMETKSEAPYTDLMPRDTTVEYSELKSTASNEHPYINVPKTNSVMYDEIKRVETTDNPYAAPHKPNTYEEIKPSIHK
ncbi:hypothetical protein XENTR_v10019589 [Xenopus tropicalis]|nr:hypothetical protein XENTR_v10019589 [Xenopus tropicalis]